jgi:hypothetical protein
MTWALSSMNAVGWTRGVTPRNGRITPAIIAGGMGRTSGMGRTGGIGG